MENIQEENFKVVHKAEGKTKDKKGNILIETSVKGLIYRSEVYKDGYLIDAKEVTCQDLSTSENKEVIFKERYMTTHNKFEALYFAERVFLQMLSSDGDYLEGEGQCVVNTSIYENIIRHEVFLNSTEIDRLDNIVERDLVENSRAFKKEYTKQHDEMVENYIKIPKFPTNTFLNSTLQRLPFYEKNPMHSFYLFLGILAFILWVLSLIVCGKAMKKIVTKVAGKEAGMVVKDLQKSMCMKQKITADTELTPEDVEDLFGSKYVILPEKVHITSPGHIKSVYIKNNLQVDLIVRVSDRVVSEYIGPLATADMIINVISPTTIYIKGGAIGSFEFKVEDEYLINSNLEKGFKGHLVLDVMNVKEKVPEPVAVEFFYLIEEE